MTERDRVGDLEIEQDLNFQKRDWRWQQIGRAALLLVIGAALLGLFGNGWLSEVQVRSADGRIALGYSRIARREAVAFFRFEVRGSPTTDSIVELWIDRDYAHSLKIGSVTPEPELTRTASDRLIYRFRVFNPADSIEIVIEATLLGFGRRRAEVGLIGGPSVRVDQLVLP